MTREHQADTQHDAFQHFETVQCKQVEVREPGPGENERRYDDHAQRIGEPPHLHPVAKSVLHACGVSRHRGEQSGDARPCDCGAEEDQHLVGGGEVQRFVQHPPDEKCGQ